MGRLLCGGTTKYSAPEELMVKRVDQGKVQRLYQGIRDEDLRRAIVSLEQRLDAEMTSLRGDVAAASDRCCPIAVSLP